MLSVLVNFMWPHDSPTKIVFCWQQDARLLVTDNSDHLAFNPYTICKPLEISAIAAGANTLSIQSLKPRIGEFL
jgi:hypothetical protein